MGLISGLVGAATGLSSPTPSIFDFAKEGISFITGDNAARAAKFAPLLKKLIGQAGGKGLTLSGTERERLTTPEVLKIRGQGEAMNEAIQNRSLGRGHGQGSGMTEAAHLKADMGALNAERGVLGQVAAADIGQRLDRQQKALGMVTDLFQRDQSAENSARAAQWESKEARNMAGSKFHRALLGFGQGYSAGGPQGARQFGTGEGQQNLGGPWRNFRGNNGLYFGNNVGRG